MTPAAHVPVELAALKRRITRHLWLHASPPLEGSSSPEELQFLLETTRRSDARRIVEIGFNGGFSAQTFLSAHPDTTVLSFDLGRRRAARTGKAYVDELFPGRHTLIEGDSRFTVAQYAREHPGETFDLAFIDGGHAYENAWADITSVRALCRAGTAVVMDDLVPWRPWGAGPARAWAQAIAEGLVDQHELYQDGKRVATVGQRATRAWALGSYRALPQPPTGVMIRS